MEKAINWLSLFLIGALVSAFLYYQLGLDDFATLFNDRASVPMIVLSFGPFIQIGVILLVRRFLSDTPAVTQLFPRLLGFDMGSPSTNLSWERVSAAVILGLPGLAFCYFWIRFMSARHRVWESATGNEVGRFDYVSPWLFIGGWNDHRFGDGPGGEGASFVPFWQPIFIMGTSTIIVVAMTVYLVHRLVGRDAMRRRAVVHKATSVFPRKR